MSSDYGITKVIEYVAHIAKEDVIVDYSGKHLEFNKPLRVMLSPLFFRGDGCYRSGKCCRNYTITFTQEGYDAILAAKPEDYGQWGLDYTKNDQLLKDIEEIPTLINGKSVMFYGDPPTAESNKLHKCDHLYYDNGMSYCDIHPVKSITCIFPHSNMYHTNGVTHIRKQQFGRNWALGCPVAFTGFNLERFDTIDVPLFERLLRIANDMQVETYIPELLEWFQKLRPGLVDGILPEEDIDITAVSVNRSLF